MALDYDSQFPEKSAKEIYEELQRLPLEIRRNLQELIKKYPLIIKPIFISEVKIKKYEPSSSFDLSDLADTED